LAAVLSQSTLNLLSKAILRQRATEQTIANIFKNNVHGTESFLKLNHIKTWAAAVLKPGKVRHWIM